MVASSQIVDLLKTRLLQQRRRPLAPDTSLAIDHDRFFFIQTFNKLQEVVFIQNVDIDGSFNVSPRKLIRPPDIQ